MMFRIVVKEGLPEAVKSKLEDVTGLYSKTESEFCEHLTHAVDKYRKAEQKLKKQGKKKIMRKVAQLQLGELTTKNKKKDKVQVPLMAEGQRQSQAQLTVMQPQIQQALQPIPPQPSTSYDQPQRLMMLPMATEIMSAPTVPPMSQVQPAPIVIHAQQPGTQYPQHNNPRGRGLPGPRRGKGRGMRSRHQTGQCWNCGQDGLLLRDCPTHQWQMPEGGRSVSVSQPQTPGPVKH